MAAKYTVFLSSNEPAWLEEIMRKGGPTSPKVLQVRALLLCASDNGPT